MLRLDFFSRLFFAGGKRNDNGKLKNWAASFVALSTAFGFVSPAFAFVDSPGVASPDGQSFTVNVHEFAISCPPSWSVSIGFDCSLGIYAVLRASTNSAFPRDNGTILCFGVPGTVCPAGVRTVTGLPPNNPNPSSAIVWIELWNSSQEFWGFGGDDVIGPMTIALAPCPPGQARNPVTGQCEGSFTIKLSNDANPPASGDLAEVEPAPAPGKDTATLRATVYDASNQPQPGVSISLRAEAVPMSGGHSHHDDNRPMGDLGGTPPLGHILENRVTGPDGAVHFTFTAPKVVGDHTITATCTDRTCNQEGSDRIWVGVKGLYQLQGNTAYELIQPNADVFHPGNHYLTTNASIVLQGIAIEWRSLYKPFGPVLHLNDASLQRGGYFDIQYQWNRGEHAEHRRGTVIDIRANNLPGAIPRGDFKDFERVARKYGAVARLHKQNTDKQHYHVRLFGRAE